jgi:hypothetical protein
MAEVDKKLVVLGNLVMRMGDALEMAVAMAEDYAKRTKSGSLRFEIKRYMRAAAHNAHLAGRAVRESSDETQISVGDDADVLVAMLLMLIDRTSGSPTGMKGMYGEIKKKYPSVLDIDLSDVEKNAFGEVIGNDTRDSGESV